MSNTTINQAVRILETHTATELAEKMGIGPSNFGPLKSGKRPLTESMAERIVGAFSGGEKKSAKKENQVTSARAANDFLEEVGHREQLDKFEGMARSIISKIMREEVVPTLNEKLARTANNLASELSKQAAELIKGLSNRVEALEGQEANIVPPATPKVEEPGEKVSAEDPAPAPPKRRRFWGRKR